MTVHLSKLANSVQFKGRIFSSDEMKQIGQSVKILGLSFINCPITDDDVLQLSKLPKLVNLLLDNTCITDQSLEYLAHLPNLQYLFINKANITGKGFTYFENHKKLACIWACSTQLNDENLRFVAKIPKLETVRIQDTLVTFDGLLSIATNSRIRVVADDILTKDQIALFEHEQRRLAKKKASIDEAEVSIAKERLIAFFQAITKWERYAEQEYTRTKKFVDELSTQCQEIFHTFCIDKPRVGSRPGWLSFAGAPHYTYEREKWVDVEQVSKNKIIFYTKNDLNLQYRYILCKKENEWKIDERQWKSGSWQKIGL